MRRKNAKKRPASRHAGVKPHFLLDVFQAYLLELEAAKLLKQGAVDDGSIVQQQCQSVNIGLSHLVELYEVLYGSRTRRVCPRTTQDSPQRAVWIEDDSYFLRKEDRKPLFYAYGGPHQSNTSVQNGVSFSVGAKCAKYDFAIRHDQRLNCDLINQLPDELLIEIFSFLPSARDRSACASVSMRWLMLQSHMPRNSFKVIQKHSSPCSQEVHSTSEIDLKDGKRIDHQPQWTLGDLSRCLDGRKATDVRLAAIAVGTGACGGLGKLSIRGGSSDAFRKGVSDIGLSAIGICCSALKVLTLWDCSSLGDSALAAIAEGCHLLEKLDLLKCPAIGDRGLQCIGKNCPMLSCLNLDECALVGDIGLKAIGEGCTNLQTLTVQNCPLIGGDGIEAVLLNCKKLKKMTLGGVRMGDKVLVSIGVYCRALVCLNLHNLEQVTEGGFVAFSKTPGLPFLKQLSISGCRSFTDRGLALLGSSCHALRQVSLLKCENISDLGLTAFVEVASLLEVLHVEKCKLITGKGLTAVLVSRTGKLREASFQKCDGIEDQNMGLFFSPTLPRDSSVKTISLADCSNVGNKCLALVGFLCPDVADLDLSGLTGVTDEGLLPCLCNGSNKLTSVNVKGCVKLTDWAVCAIAQQSGGSLKNLILDGCKLVTDKGIMAVAKHCNVLEDLDISQCAITDDGIMELVNGVGQTLISLNLLGCRGITDKVLRAIEVGCPDLQDLNLKSCEGLTQKSVDSFSSRLWKCDVLSS